MCNTVSKIQLFLFFFCALSCMRRGEEYVTLIYTYRENKVSWDVWEYPCFKNVEFRPDTVKTVAIYILNL